VALAAGYAACRSSPRVMSLSPICIGEVRAERPEMPLQVTDVVLAGTKVGVFGRACDLRARRSRPFDIGGWERSPAYLSLRPNGFRLSGERSATAEPGARACQARPRLKLKYSFGPARLPSTLRSPMAAST
jgi:hypothetical protein